MQMQILQDVDDSWTHVGPLDGAHAGPLDRVHVGHLAKPQASMLNKIQDVVSGYRFHKVIPESNRLKILVTADICRLFDGLDVQPQNRYHLTRSLVIALQPTSLDEQQRIELCVSLLDLVNSRVNAKDEDFHHWITNEAVHFIGFLFDFPRSLAGSRRKSSADATLP